MKMPQINRQSLWNLAALRSFSPQRVIADSHTSLPLPAAGAAGWLRSGVAAWQGRSVLIRTHRQLPAICATLALDGLARRILLCPPDVTDTQIPVIMRNGEVDAVLTETDLDITGEEHITEYPPLDTEWVLFTSGTSGAPKLVLHSLASLTGPLNDNISAASSVWSTFYDIRRYGGLQILLRALLGGGPIILSESDEPVASFLNRLAAADVTHISGTPSHWRRALMSGAASRISPYYVRLSGEIVSQDILDRLHLLYPSAVIAHAFASTEAGVAFDIRDGIAGFPPSVLGTNAATQINIEDGTLRIRSSRLATCYLGSPARHIVDADGFVDTNDIVELRDGRYHFIGRREGVVNVGGLKVYPEEVEGVINTHPDVLMSRVWCCPSPITGTLIAADVVLRASPGTAAHNFAVTRLEIVTACRSVLVAHKVPVRVNQVAEIPVTASGKIVRRHA